MKAYKGFNKDMTSLRGFHYKEGETYYEKCAILGVIGFHACEDPMDCLEIYNPSNSVYHEVELDGVAYYPTNGIDNTARAGTKITIGRELSLDEIINLSIEYRKNNGKSQKSVTFTTAEIGLAFSSWYKNLVLTFGYGSAAVATGFGGRALATGIETTALSTGCRGMASADNYFNSAITTGEDGIVKGKKGSAIFCVERKRDSDGILRIVSALGAVVDGETIKEDTWYTVKDGKWVESTDYMWR